MGLQHPNDPLHDLKLQQRFTAEESQVDFFFVRSIAINEFNNFFGDRQRYGDIALAHVTVCAAEVAREGGQEGVFFHRERSQSEGIFEQYNYIPT
jgi:hypothetical protein